MNETFPILIAEDDNNDALILQRALRTAGFRNPIHVSKDGADVLRYLKREGPYHDRERYRFPVVLFTDLKMPNVDGFEVLHWLQVNPHCNVIPRLVMSASAESQDVARAYQLGANSYLMKPPTFEGLVENMRRVLDYWSMCRRPLLPPDC
jgi:CheY-like chemotaxis protein